MDFHLPAIEFGYGAMLLAAVVGAVSGWMLRGRPRLHSAKKIGVPVSTTMDTRASATALRQAQQAQHRSLELLINLPEMVNKMGSARSSVDLCRTTARSLYDVAGASTIGLFVADDDGENFSLEVSAGLQRESNGVCFVRGQGRLGRMAELIGVREGSELHLTQESLGPCDAIFRADLCVTLRRHDTVFGFVVMDGVQRSDAMTRRVVQMLADVHAVSAEGVRALDQERLKADLDQLTGLYNRRHLDRRLVAELERARVYGVPLSVFLFDVDNFKHFNDTNGHQAGDECLRLIAHIARSVTRSSDVMCRYGGEEFLVILVGADKAQAWHHADRIRQTIAQTAFPHGQKQPLGCVSISGGVASFPVDALQAKEIVELADQALYRAKQAGRNRVIAAGVLQG